MAISLGVRLSVKFDLSQYKLFTEQKVKYGELLEEQGYCNLNHLLYTSDKKYLLREFKLSGPDRKLEFKIQQKAYQKGIAGRPCVLDEKSGVMICEFIEGAHKEKLSRKEIRQIARVLQKLHQIAVRTKPLSLVNSFTSKPIEVKQALKKLRNHQKDYVLCHNDLNPKNILFSDTIKLIDWEYAVANERYFDLASLCVEFDFDQREQNYLMQAYFGNSSKADSEKLDAYKVIYMTLCIQWFEKNEKASHA